MLCTRIYCGIALVLLICHVAVCAPRDRVIDALKEMITASEKSLSLEIKHMSELLENKLSTRNGDARFISNVENKPAVDENDITNAITDLEQLSRRIKRAFSEEKSEIKRLMADLKAEIGTFGKELSKLLQELKVNQVKAETDLEKKNDEMKDAVTTDLTAFLNGVLLQDLKPSLTTSLEAMSKDVTMEIGTFGKEISNLLQELKDNQVKAETDLEKKNDEMKDAVTTDLTAFLNGVLVQDLKPSLTTSLEAMSQDVTMEIGTFGKELGNLLQELKENQVKAETDLEKKIYEMKDAVTTNGVLVQYLKPSLTTSLEAMSKDVTMVTDQCVSGIQSLTPKHDNHALNFNSTLQEMFVDISKLSINCSSANIVGKLTEFAKETSYLLEVVAERILYITGTVNGTVRIVNITETATTIGGRLEVYKFGEWGTVCDDGFNTTEAKVACVSLGFPSAASFMPEAYFGEGVNNTWMDDVKCRGDEQTLFDCHGVFGCHNCVHGEDVGVICNK